MKPLLLWSDLLIFLLVIALGLFFYSLQRDPRTRERNLAWQFQDAMTKKHGGANYA